MGKNGRAGREGRSDCSPKYATVQQLYSRFASAIKFDTNLQTIAIQNSTKIILRISSLMATSQFIS